MSEKELNEEAEIGGKREMRLKFSLSTAILLSMALGILTGILFGELVAWLEIIGNAFIKLLQMTILPYITVSLIVGIGSLTYEKARVLATKAGILLLLSWVIAFFFILIAPLAFPEWESASFYSNALVEIPPKPDFLALYIPANPFYSLSENLVPAVVLFSICIGVALIGIDQKRSFLDNLGVLSQALVKVAGFVVKLTPVGVFAIAASAAGTMTVDELSKLQVYIIVFTVFSLVLAFWVLPALVAITTPFKYKDVVGVSRDALVTAFTTGNLFVVLPALTESAKALFKKYDAETEHTGAYVDVIIPVSFNFPNIGKLIMLMFILFAGWFSGNEMSLGDYPQFLISGLLSFFGGVDIALPFMLDQMRMPSDLYQLYVVTGIVNGRTATLLAAMNLLTFTLLATASVTGKLQVEWRRVWLLAGATLGITLLSIVTMRVYFQTTVSNAYEKDQQLAGMQLLKSDSEATVLSEVPPVKPGTGPLLQQILDRGVLRVGFYPNSTPYSYINNWNKLVGFDVDMMHLLAQDLDVKLEFMPYQYDTLPDQLRKGEFDLAISGIPVSPDHMRQMTLTDSYMDVTLAFVVKDHMREVFGDYERLLRTPDLSIGINRAAGEYFINGLERALPEANIVEINSNLEFLTDNPQQLDAILTSAEAGSAMTLQYPSFQVAVPKPVIVKQPLAYAVAGGGQAFARFVSQWMDLKRKARAYQERYDHWILGTGAEVKEPRWSVVRNVFGWVD